MRKRPIDETNTESTRLPASVRADAAALADLLNDADKPQGFPVRDVSKSKSTARPRQVSHPHAMGLAMAVVLDLIDAEVVSPVDLLRRSALLEDINPDKARIRQAMKDEEKLLERFGEAD